MFFKIHSRAVEAKPALKLEQNWAEFLTFCHFAFLPKLPYKKSCVCASLQ